MEIRIKKKEKREIKIEIQGEGHTFCNALQKTLLEDSGIEYTGYSLPHPLVAQPTVYVRTKGKRKAKDALVDATKKLSKMMDEFVECFKKACEAKTM